MTRAPAADLAGGQGEQLALPQPGVGRGGGHQLVQVPAPSGGQGLAEPGHIITSGDLGGVDELRGFPGDAHLRARARAGRGLPVHLFQPGAGQVPGRDPRRDDGRQAPAQPCALPRGGRGVDDLLHVGDPDVLAADRGDDRGDEPLAQPPLGIGVPAGPRPAGRMPVRAQVPGDQVRAGPLQVRRIGLQPLSHLGQLRRQLVLGHRLALPPPPGLVPHRPPPVPLPPRRVHRDPALQLHHHTTVTPRGRASGSGREDGPASAPWPRTSGRGPGYSGTGWLWVFCGDLGPRRALTAPWGSLSFCALRR